jgi:hypothetical protein
MQILKEKKTSLGYNFLVFKLLSKDDALKLKVS